MEEISRLDSCPHNTNIALIKEGMDNIGIKIDRMDSIVFGNGKEGLLVRMTVTEKSLFRSWWFIGVVGGLVFAAAIKILFFGVTVLNVG